MAVVVAISWQRFPAGFPWVAETVGTAGLYTTGPIICEQVEFSVIMRYKPPTHADGDGILIAIIRTNGGD